MTPAEEEALFLEIQREVTPDIAITLIMNGGHPPNMQQAFLIGHKIAQMTEARGLGSTWFIQFGLLRIEALRKQRAAEEEAAVKALRARQEADAARMNPYKCQLCPKRFPTSDKRSVHKKVAHAG